eukprot:1653134-Rhodomonas_salina.2
MAAGLRALCIAFGVGSVYDGDVLGDQQWAWLEQQLAEPSQVCSVSLLCAPVRVSILRAGLTGSEGGKAGVWGETAVGLGERAGVSGRNFGWKL